MEMLKVVRGIVVDDSENTLTTLKNILKDFHIDIVGEGSNGEEAVKLYREFRPDIVFADSDMPIYDGYFALDEIRAMNPYAPIVLLSEDPLFEHKLLMKESTPTATLHKPFDTFKVMSLIHNLKEIIPYYSEKELQKVLIASIIERTLRKIGLSEYEKVKHILKNNFNSSFDDCLDHPDYLKEILRDRFGYSFNEILANFNIVLDGFKSHKQINNFITTLMV